MSHLKVLGVRSVTWSKIHAQNQQVLGDTLQNVAATEKWLQGFVRCCILEQLYIW